MFNIITVPCTPGVFKVRCPDDYRKWLVSMFTLFGTKWVKIFCGPMWKIMSTSQSVPEPRHGGLDPLEVLFIELRCILAVFHCCFRQESTSLGSLKELLKETLLAVEFLWDQRFRYIISDMPKLFYQLLGTIIAEDT